MRMTSPDHLLTFRNWNGEELRLIPPTVMEFDAQGEPILFNPMNPNHFGRSFLRPDYAERIVWTADTDEDSTSNINEFHGFHCGATISPRIRRIIEDYGCPNIEFIPVNIVSRRDGRKIDEWSFVNVFDWRDIFDLQRSVATWVDFPQPMAPTFELLRRFGDKLMIKVEELVLLPDADLSGLFLAKGPSETICRNVYIGQELADRINEGMPGNRQATFPRFPLDRRDILRRFRAFPEIRPNTVN